MATGGQGATPRQKPTLFLFIDFCRLCLDLISLSNGFFTPICSVVYALGLVRLISRCYAVPQGSMHPNHCLLVPGLPISFGFPFVLACPVLACIILFYWTSLMSRHCEHTVQLHPYSVFVVLSGFLPHR